MTSVLDVQRFKLEGRRFAVLTAYDYLSAQILDQAGIPILLVGDSLVEERIAERDRGRVRERGQGLDLVVTQAAGAPAEMGRARKNAKRPIPIVTNIVIWRRTRNPLPIRARLASESVRQARRRCTISWSAPWLAIVRNVPPRTPAQNV